MGTKIQRYFAPNILQELNVHLHFLQTICRNLMYIYMYFGKMFYYIFCYLLIGIYQSLTAICQFLLFLFPIEKYPLNIFKYEAVHHAMQLPMEGMVLPFSFAAHPPFGAFYPTLFHPPKRFPESLYIYSSLVLYPFLWHGV